MNYIIVAFTILLTLTNCTTTNSTNKYDALLQQEPYNILTDSIKSNATNANLYITRGLLLSKNDKADAALADFEKAYNLVPNETNAAYYSVKLMAYAKYDTAITFLQQCTQKFPTNVYLNNLYGQCYIEKNKYQEAINIYDNTLAQDSLNVLAWIAKGFCYQELQKDEEALYAFEKSFAITPTTKAGYELAAMYAIAKNPKTLIICTQLKILELQETKTVQPTYYEAVYYNQIGNTNKALALLDSCITNDYTFADAYIDKSQIYIDMKKYNEALKILTIAKQNDNKNPEVYYLTGKCFVALGKINEAKYEFENTLLLDNTYTAATEALEQLRK